jgi:hypothetical protein
MPTTLTLKWETSTDPDGDKLTYRLYIGTDPSFTGVTPIILASVANESDYARGFGCWGMAIVVCGILAVGGFSKRKKKAGLLFLAIALVLSAQFLSCGGGGGGDDDETPRPPPPPPPNNEFCYTVQLEPNSTYYWKVIAHDGVGGTAESDAYTLITRQ